MNFFHVTALSFPKQQILLSVCKIELIFGISPSQLDLEKKILFCSLLLESPSEQQYFGKAVNT